VGSVDDQLDARAIREALSEACPTVAIAAVADATSGYTSRQWLAETDEGRLLVKIPMRIPDPEHMRRMIVATRLASEQGVPVIRYRGFLPHSAATGTAVVVQEFVEAERASDVWDGLDEESRLRVAEQFGALVATVHQSSSSWFGAVLGGPRFATWPEYLADLVQRLLKPTSSPRAERCWRRRWNRPSRCWGSRDRPH
jgi:aminoglycoside phosphotransferase (APT) family kinase protein